MNISRKGWFLQGNELRALGAAGVGGSAAGGKSNLRIQAGCNAARYFIFFFYQRDDGLKLMSL